MSRHLLDRPFDQERFDKLKREAETASYALATFNLLPGKVHERNVLLFKLRYRLHSIEDHGEYYSVFKSSRLYYTLDTLEDMIGKARKFLDGG